MRPDSLAVLVELAASAPPAGSVVLVNRGTTTVRVWRTGNTWGDEALWFEVSRRGRTGRIVRRPQIHTVNVPSSLPLPPGQRHRWRFDLGDGTWETGAALDELAGSGAQLVAVYDVRPSPEATVHGVWTGRLRSEPVPLDELPPRP